VYGDSEVLPKHEKMPYDPKSPYAASKATSELFLRAFYLTYGLKGIALRYFNVFGRRQDPTSPYSAVIPRFMTAALKDEVLYVEGDGLQSRDFTYIEDVVTANLLALEAKEAEGVAMNIAFSQRISILDLAKRIIQLTGSRSSIEHRPPRPGDVRHSLADITKAQERLGYQPRYTLEGGLKESLVWYKGTLSK
jgi:nucleoside-diphosphate-sugar epimerase